MIIALLLPPSNQKMVESVGVDNDFLRHISEIFYKFYFRYFMNNSLFFFILNYSQLF